MLLLYVSLLQSSIQQKLFWGSLFLEATSLPISIKFELGSVPFTNYNAMIYWPQCLYNANSLLVTTCGTAESAYAFMFIATRFCLFFPTSVSVTVDDRLLRRISKETANLANKPYQKIRFFVTRNALIIDMPPTMETTNSEWVAQFHRCTHKNSLKKLKFNVTF